MPPKEQATAAAVQTKLEVHVTHSIRPIRNGVERSVGGRSCKDIVQERRPVIISDAAEGRHNVAEEIFIPHFLITTNLRRLSSGELRSQVCHVTIVSIPRTLFPGIHGSVTFPTMSLIPNGLHIPRKMPRHESISAKTVTTFVHVSHHQKRRTISNVATRNETWSWRGWIHEGQWWTVPLQWEEGKLIEEE